MPGLAGTARTLGCLLLLLLAAAGWLFRDRVVEAARGLAGGRAEPAAAGRPGTRALRAARAKTDALARARVDSVILTAPEVASLVGAGLDPEVRRQLDSLEVRLGNGRIEVGARLATARLPRELLGPFGFALRNWERVSGAGPLRVVGPGRGEWLVDRLEVRGVPLPTDAVGEVLGRALGEPGRRALPVRLPPGVREIHIRPSGAVLIGARRS